MSKSNRFPDGLANSSGLVGRNLMVDLGCVAFGVFEHPLNEFKSVQVSRVVQDYYTADPKRGFYGGGGIDARFGAYPIAFALGGLPADAPRWGKEYKQMLAHYYNRTMMLLAHTSCLAQEKNSISLDPEVKDAWGLPAIRVDSAPNASNLHAVKELFVNDFSVDDFIDSDLFHREALGLRLKRHVQLISDCEVRTRYERTLNFQRVDLMVSGPPFAFSLDGRKALRLAGPSWRAPASMLTISGE